MLSETSGDFAGDPVHPSSVIVPNSARRVKNNFSGLMVSSYLIK
jgi:hypothetical protein